MNKVPLEIIIPVFNEGKTIYELLNKVVNINLVNDIEKEIIAVDDCSLDNSKDEINSWQKNISFVPQNLFLLEIFLIIKLLIQKLTLFLKLMKV